MNELSIATAFPTQIVRRHFLVGFSEGEVFRRMDVMLNGLGCRRAGGPLSKGRLAVYLTRQFGGTL